MCVGWRCLVRRRVASISNRMSAMWIFWSISTPPLDGFFGLQAELSSLLGRPVDLVEAGAVRNPYVLASIERNREVVYAA